MNGIYLKFYAHEHNRHHGILLYEWLLERAKAMGIKGGSAFRAIAGFGHHGKLQEEHFFELAGNLTVEIVFMVTEEEAQKLLDLVEQEKVQIFYVKMRADYGIINGPG